MGSSAMALTSRPSRMFCMSMSAATPRSQLLASPMAKMNLSNPGLLCGRCRVITVRHRGQGLPLVHHRRGLSLTMFHGTIREQS